MSADVTAAQAALPPPPRRTRRMARWMSRFYGLSALVLVPWIVYLALTLPHRSTASHYRLAWVGFDVGLTIALSWTAYLARKVDVRVVLPAVATGTMLIIDAWFDITTANGDEALMAAVASAVFVELPIAAVSIWLARRAINGLITRVAQVAPGPYDGDCADEAPDPTRGAPVTHGAADHGPATQPDPLGHKVPVGPTRR